MEHPDDVDTAAAALRVDAAVAARRKRRELGRQAGESATFVGTLTDLAERRTTVTITASTGRLHAGRITAVGDDFVALDGDHLTTLLPLRSIVGVMAAGDDAASVDDRSPARAAGLAAMLAELAVDRPRVTVRGSSGDPISGCLVDVGIDVARLRPDGQPGVVYVALPSLAEVSVTGSG